MLCFVSWSQQISNPKHKRKFPLELKQQKAAQGGLQGFFTLRHRWCGWEYLDLQRQVGADGVQQHFGGFLPAHEHQLQIHVPFDQKTFSHQTYTRHPAEQWHGVRPEGENTHRCSQDRVF